MRFTIMAVSALAALAACNNASDDADTDDEAVEAEAEPEQMAMLPNGAPAYPGIDLSAVADQGVDGERQTVSFETGATPDEVYDFYRTAYLGDDYDISSTSITVRVEEGDAGGSVTVSRSGDVTRGSLSPRGEGTEFDLTKEYGDGFPAYPNANADSVEERTSGDYRYVSFETSDSLTDVFDFYRTALRNGFTLGSLNMSAQSRTMRRNASISISSRYNAEGSRVSVTNYDPARESASGGQ